MAADAIDPVGELAKRDPTMRDSQSDALSGVSLPLSSVGLRAYVQQVIAQMEAIDVRGADGPEDLWPLIDEWKTRLADLLAIPEGAEHICPMCYHPFDTCRHCDKLSALAIPAGIHGWQPIETAPKDGSRFVGGWYLLNGSWVWDTCRYQPDATAIDKGGYFYATYGGSPTHWMPLPPSPRDQESAK